MNALREESLEGCFLKAIEIARRQVAKSLELRASVSIDRWWQGREKHEARQMLPEMYGWFTEGLDMVDLRQTNMLLEVLSHDAEESDVKGAQRHPTSWAGKTLIVQVLLCALGAWHHE
jgi:hypothetical protein